MPNIKSTPIITPKYNKIDEKILKKIEEFIDSDDILIDLIDKYPYGMDGTLFNPETIPELVVLPRNSKQIQKIAKLCNEKLIPLTVRGAGTSLSGGPLPIYGGIVIDMRHLNKIEKIDIPNNIAIVEPGVICDELNNALNKYGYFFPPDPGSSSAATLGGMVGNNAGGIQAFKYGVTSNYVIWLEVVLANGDKVEFGSLTLKSTSSFNMVGLMVGSEGQLGIVTKIGLKIRPKPTERKTAFYIFDQFISIPNIVQNIREKGILPNMIEFLDKTTTKVCFEYLGGEYTRYPEGYFFLVEIDGEKFQVESDFSEIHEFCMAEHPLAWKQTENEDDRDDIISARKAALPALSKLAPTTTIEDCTINLSNLTKAIEKLEKIAERLAPTNIKVATFGHLEGNLHPTFLFNENIPEDVEDFELALKIVYEEIVIPLEGTITGEHGVGLVKSPFIELEHPTAINLMYKLKKFMDPNLILNPGKGKGMPPIISQHKHISNKTLTINKKTINPAALPKRNLKEIPPLSCMRCGFCVTSCPSYLNYKKEVYSPRGKLALLRGILRKDLQINNKLLDIWYACTLCAACAEKCPALIDTLGLFEGFRARVLNPYSEIIIGNDSIEKINAINLENKKEK